jgi:cytoskeleton protein RodZ
MTVVDAAARVVDGRQTVESGSIGGLLAAARLRRGLEQADVARELHLHLRHVQWLEQGHYASFENAVFVKGYLRAFARLVGLDGDQLVSLFETAYPEQRQVKLLPPVLASRQLNRQSMARKINLGVLSGVLLVCAIVGWMNRTAMPVNLVVVSALLDEITVKPASDVAVIPDALPAQPVAVVSKVLSPPVGDLAFISLLPNPLPLPPTAAPQLQAETPLAESAPALHMEFSDTCWVQIKNAAGKVVHEQLHQKNEVVDVAVEAPVQIWFGKGTAVNMSYKGTAVNVPVKPGYQSARFVLQDEPGSGDIE